MVKVTLEELLGAARDWPFRSTRGQKGARGFKTGGPAKRVGFIDFIGMIGSSGAGKINTGRSDSRSTIYCTFSTKMLVASLLSVPFVLISDCPSLSQVDFGPAGQAVE